MVFFAFNTWLDSEEEKRIFEGKVTILESK